MKQNGNSLKQGNYYIGLDVGTNSIGWAVTDEAYRIKKHGGNAMWGVRLFEEAKDAQERRSSRIARRRAERKKQRLLLLEMLFAQEIAKVDPVFYRRLHESELWVDEKSHASKFALFNDKGFTDKEYHRRYPTVYHLRSELLQTSEPHDVRMVYLALHHIIKNRGHFLYETAGDTEEVITTQQALEQLKQFLLSACDQPFEPKHPGAFLDVLQSNENITAKKKALRMAYGEAEESEEINLPALLDLLAGASVRLEVLFSDPSLKNDEVTQISLKNVEENADAYLNVLGERMELIETAKCLFDAARLSQMRGSYAYISQAKVAQYEQNRAELRALKQYVRATIPGKYKLIFSEKRQKLDNYAAYSRYRHSSGEYCCDQEKFCKFLLGKEVDLPQPDSTDVTMCAIYRKIKDGTFLPRLRSSENGVIPYQLNKQELVQILKQAARYLPFLNQRDEDGLSVQEKIIKTFAFRVPYYVGPISDRAGHHWAVRFAEKAGEKVYPWNFEQVIDTERSAVKFMENLIGRCTYTGENVLPKDSLLYSEYALLNEINPLKVAGHPLPIDVKKQLVQDLFYASNKKVTKKSIANYLKAKGLLCDGDAVSGIDDKIKTTLRSYHDFKSILDKTADAEMVESIIQSILVFGNDKKMLRKWLERNTHDLTPEDIKHICRLKYSDWGNLSETFLTQIYHPDENGEAKTILDYLRDTNCNLMQLLSSEFQFSAQAKAHLDALLGNGQTLSDRLDNMYIAPAVRRSIRQTLRVVDELVDVEKSAPKKIFIEMARPDARQVKKERTESRKDKLIALYKACKMDSDALFEKLSSEEEGRLRSDKLYLYYTQFGRCMYSGESIVLEELLRGETYDIDHIFPQSRIKDNSLDNRVLVKNTLNREKTNEYPIKADIRKAMQPFWQSLKQKGFISDKKYDRLVRSAPLTLEELSSFVARQLVETQQSTKALATLLQDIYGDKVHIVYSKAGNVSDFRHKFGLMKCREVNDLHHAKDAYLNIVVGNVYDTKFTQKFFLNLEHETYSLNKVFDFDTPGAWDKDISIPIVKKQMAKNNVLVTRMPHEVRGALYDLQLMPAGNGQLPKKRGKDIERYGGYNKLTGAYFCVVEHTAKKKRIRTMEPVFLYQKEAYEKDPVAHCKNVLGLQDPVIVVPKVRIDALLELNGSRQMVSGRTGDQIVLKHTYQLLVGAEFEKYIKNLIKYNGRCAQKREELPVTEHDGISAEENLALYRYLARKCDEPVYQNCFSAFSIMGNEMREYEEKFIAMSVWEQTKLLAEVVKAFGCNAVYADFKPLSGKGIRGRICMNKDISKLSSAFLIHQSVTGMYENKIDLLK